MNTAKNIAAASAPRIRLVFDEAPSSMLDCMKPKSPPSYIVKRAESVDMPGDLAGTYRVIHGSIHLPRPTEEFSNPKTGQRIPGVATTVLAKMGDEVWLVASDAARMLEADIVEPVDAGECKRLMSVLRDFVTQERARALAEHEALESAIVRRLSEPAPDVPESELVQRCVALEAKIAGLFNETTMRFKSRVNSVWTPPPQITMTAAGRRL